MSVLNDFIHLYTILYYTGALLVVIGLNSTTNTNRKKDRDRDRVRGRESRRFRSEECLDKTFDGLLLGTMFNHLGVQFNLVTTAFGLHAYGTRTDPLGFVNLVNAAIAVRSESKFHAR